MKRLSTTDALRFAIHCLTCRRCAAATEEAERFVRAMRDAAEQVGPEPHDRLRPRRRVSLAPATATPLRGFCMQMRFYVTGYTPPRNHG
jgi:hypothetical protein